MRGIIVRDYDRLKEILENPEIYGYYSLFVGGARVIEAKVWHYKHQDGAYIKDVGRRWIAVRVKYVFHDDQESAYEYDIALWKLKRTELWKRLLESGAIEEAFSMPETEKREETESIEA